MRTVNKTSFQRSNTFQFEKAKLWNISSSTYWNRLWIKQEVLLGKDLWIYYGAVYANWKDLLFAASLGQTPARTTSLSRIRQSITRRDSEDVPSDNYEAMLSLLKERTFTSTQITDLPGLVRKFHTAECVDGRDKIYALLSLVDLETRRKIKVDYAKPFFKVLMENYTYWTGEDLGFVQLPTKETSTPVYQYQTLYHQLSKILSRQEVETLYDEQYNRQDIFVDGTLTTFALSEVLHVTMIAMIGSSEVEPCSDLKGGKSDNKTCVLRVSIQSQSKWSSQTRSYIVYATKPPEQGDLVARIGSCDFFCRNGGNGPEIFAYGVEMKSSPKHRLRDVILRHPCVWLSQRFPNVSFTVVQEEVRHSSATQHYKTDGKLMILCNSSAMLTLLFESFEDGLTRSEPGIDNAGWSPYDFGIEHGLLASCLACSNFDSRHTAFEPECCCQWLDRSFNVSAIARTKSHDATV